MLHYFLHLFIYHLWILTTCMFPLFLCPPVFEFVNLLSSRKVDTTAFVSRFSRGTWPWCLLLNTQALQYCSTNALNPLVNIVQKLELGVIVL
jgi:hypothetical protein